MTTKRCTKCKKRKARKRFPQNARMSDELSSWCRECHREAGRKRYRENPQKHKDYQREYVRKNREKVRRRRKIYAEKNKKKISRYKKGWRERNREKMKEYLRVYYQKNRKRIRAQNDQWRKNNYEYHLETTKNYQLKVLYGVDRAWLTNAIKSQNGKCKICRTEEAGGVGTWNIDHDHSTGEIRGLLCFCCNIGLGYFKDDPSLLRKAAKYLTGSSTGLFSIGRKPGGGTRVGYLKYTHGITIQQFESILKKQRRKCAICKTKKPDSLKRWKIDHDHLTKQIRGILCGRCNFGLGYFKDNPKFLVSAAMYLEKYLSKRKSS